MTEQLRILACTLQEIQINNKESLCNCRRLINKCAFESGKIIEINDLLEDLMNISFLIRYTIDTVAICCIVYITPFVSINYCKRNLKKLFLKYCRNIKE